MNLVQAKTSIDQCFPMFRIKSGKLYFSLNEFILSSSLQSPLLFLIIFFCSMKCMGRAVTEMNLYVSKSKECFVLDKTVFTDC